MREMADIERLIEYGEHFCIVPWIHLHITCLGNMCACCNEAKGPYARGYGNINRNTFQELWQGESIRMFRLNLLRDEADSRCVACYQQANLGSWNFRNWYNLLYAKKYIDWVANTDEAGFAPDAKPVFCDIRFSNLCNLKCRSCSYWASSGWFEDTMSMGQSVVSKSRQNNKRSVIGLENTPRLLDDLDPYLPYM